MTDVSAGTQTKRSVNHDQEVLAHPASTPLQLRHRSAADPKRSAAVAASSVLWLVLCTLWHHACRPAVTTWLPQQFAPLGGAVPAPPTTASMTKADWAMTPENPETRSIIKFWWQQNPCHANKILEQCSECLLAPFHFAQKPTVADTKMINVVVPTIASHVSTSVVFCHGN